MNSQRFTSTTETTNSMKELFSDRLKVVMEAELKEKKKKKKSGRTSDKTEKVWRKIIVIET